jgi:hypothetical protein
MRHYSIPSKASAPALFPLPLIGNTLPSHASSTDGVCPPSSSAGSPIANGRTRYLSEASASTERELDRVLDTVLPGFCAAGKGHPPRSRRPGTAPEALGGPRHRREWSGERTAVASGGPGPRRPARRGRGDLRSQPLHTSIIVPTLDNPMPEPLTVPRPLCLLPGVSLYDSTFSITV